MKNILVSILTLLAFCSCGEREVKKMIIEPHPPTAIANAASCDLHFSKSASLKETAIKAARISEECGLNDKEFEEFIKQELTEQK